MSDASVSAKTNVEEYSRGGVIQDLDKDTRVIDVGKVADGCESSFDMIVPI
jgi:hypothetical protein